MTVNLVASRVLPTDQLNSCNSCYMLVTAVDGFGDVLGIHTGYRGKQKEEALITAFTSLSSLNLNQPLRTLKITPCFLCCILFHHCRLSGEETAVCSYTITKPPRSFLYSAPCI